MEAAQLIEKYLDGSLGEKERKLVEERAVMDSEFHNLIRLHREVDQSLSDKEFAAFQRALKETEKVYLQTTLSARKTSLGEHNRQWMLIVRIAAIVILIAGAGVAFNHLQKQKSSTEKIYTKYYKAYEIDGTLRSSSPSDNLFTIAIADYSQGNYAEALVTLNSIVKTDTGNNLAWFLRGLAYLGINDAIEAVKSFRAVPGTWESPCSEHRDWYLALAYLRTGEIAEASLMFSAMVKANGYYANDAANILKRIR